MKTKVLATCRQNYGGKWFNRDEEIVTDNEQDAEDLVALNFARHVDPPRPIEKNTKNSYKRRDMKAEH